MDGSGQREEGEDDLSMSLKVLLMGSRDNLGLIEGEASVGLTRGDAGEKSAVFDDVSTVGLTDVVRGSDGAFQATMSH